MGEKSQPRASRQSADSCYYDRSLVMRLVLGPGRPAASDKSSATAGLPRRLLDDYRIRIVIFCAFWAAVLFLAAGLDGPLLKGEFDLNGLGELGIIEDVYTMSLLLSLAFLLLAARKTFSMFYEAFFGNDGLSKCVDYRKMSPEKYLQLVHQGSEFIQRKGKKANLAFLVIAVPTILYLIISLWAHFSEESDLDYWYKVGNFYGNAVWAVFVVLVVGVIGVQLAWRLVAMVYQARKIVTAVGRENALIIPARVSEREGIGSVFSLAYWMALIPLTPILSLVSWFAFSDGMFFMQTVTAAFIMSATALIAFFSTAEALISAAKRQRIREINEISTAIDGLFRRFKEVSENDGVRDEASLDKLTNQMGVLVQIRAAKMVESVWPTDSFVQLVGIIMLQIVFVLMSPDIGSLLPVG